MKGNLKVPALGASAPRGKAESNSAHLLTLAALVLSFLLLTATGSRAQGNADLIWQNTTGGVYDWHMSGTAISDSGYVGQNVDPSWQIVAQTDLFNDGRTTLIWENSYSGQVYYWHLNTDNRTILNQGYFGFAVDVSWRIVGVTHNSLKDSILIWENYYTGDVYYWRMRGTSLLDSNYVLAGVPLEWTIQAVGDIFGDGTSTLLWRNVVSGDVYYWHLGSDGITILTSGYLYKGVPGNWAIVGTADIDGNGAADILWEDRYTNDVYYWAMSGLTTINSGYLYRGVPREWKIRAAGNRPTFTMPNKMQSISNDGGIFKVLSMDSNDNWLVNGTTEWATRGVPTGLSDAMYANGSQVSGAAFDALGNWVVIVGSNGFQSVGIPSGLASALQSINSQNGVVHAVALGPNNGYVVAFGIGGYFSSNVPQGLVNTLNSINANHQTVTAIALNSTGGYVITYGVGGYSAQGVPQALINELNMANSNNWTVRAIALGASNSYAIASSGRWAVSSTR